MDSINILKNNDLTIASGASLSSALSLDTQRVIAISMPATWTTANLTFQASSDGTTYKDIYLEDGTELNYSASASRYILCKPVHFAGVKFLKLRSGTSETAVNQAGDRTIRVITREY